jgi:hypothetical protein
VLAGYDYSCNSVVESMWNRMKCGRTAENDEQARNSEKV